MRILTMLLLVASSALLATALNGCEDTCRGDIDYGYLDRYAVVNRTNSTIKFFAPDLSLSLASGDSIRMDEFDKKFLYAGEPKGIEVGDSTAYLLNSPTVNGEEISSSILCWHYNSRNEQIGQYEWMHTYLIDDQWIIDAWTESMSGRCVPGAKSTHYE